MPRTNYLRFQRPDYARIYRQQDTTRSAGRVCVSFFEDTNADQFFNQSEERLDAGSFTLAENRYEVTTADGLCVDNLDTGTVTFEATPPAGYGFMTGSRLEVTIYPGRTIDIALGVVEGLNIPDNPPAVDEPTLNEVNTVSVVSGEAASDESAIEQIINNSAYIVLGMAVAVGLLSTIVVWSYRR